MQVADPLKFFKFYNVYFTDEADENAKATCPFCNKASHFFASKKTLCWDCKSCGESGNEYTFIAKIFERAETKLTPALRKQLALERKLPEKAFIRPLAFWNQKYIIPYFNEFDKLCNLGLYTFGKPLLKTPKIPLAIFNLEKLYDIAKQNDPIYLCEGEWDAIALEFLISELEKPGIILGMPGAGTFKLDWIDYFHNKIVYVCYDKDTAGLKGQCKIRDFVEPVAQEIKYIHWPSNYDEGFDVRDLVQIGVKSELNYAYVSLHSFLKYEHPLDAKSDTIVKKNDEPVKVDEVEDYISYEEVIDEFRKWLEIDEDFENAIKLTLATVISTKIPGPDPLWLFLVGPPGCGKSAILTSLKESKKWTDFQSTLSSTALISGWVGK